MGCWGGLTSDFSFLLLLPSLSSPSAPHSTYYKVLSLSPSKYFEFIHFFLSRRLREATWVQAAIMSPLDHLETLFMVLLLPLLQSSPHKAINIIKYDLSALMFRAALFKIDKGGSDSSVHGLING